MVCSERQKICSCKASVPRQNLNPDRQLQVRKSSNKHLLSHYRALGWTGMTAAEAKAKARDLTYMTRMSQKHYAKLGTVGNYTLRHRFKDPTM